MKKEDFVSTLVMTTVSILMLVGVTIAWYTAVYAHPTVTGMNMEAAEVGGIKIALKSGGEDIADLDEDKQYADIGLTELLNIVNGQMAPGAYGSVTFYVTSLNEDINACQITPSFVPEFEQDATQEKKDHINSILDKHFDFYSDEDMTNLVDEENPMEVELEWNTTGKGIEKPVTIYWKWHYEYPFTETEKNEKTDEEKKVLIDQYDVEDTQIGTYLEKMSFHFDFMPQYNKE